MALGGGGGGRVTAEAVRAGEALGRAAQLLRFPGALPRRRLQQELHLPCAVAVAVRLPGRDGPVLGGSPAHRYFVVLAEKCLVSRGYFYGHACWVLWGAGLEMRALESWAQMAFWGECGANSGKHQRLIHVQDSVSFLG